MNARLLVLFVHVLAATVLVGGSFVAAPAVGAAVRRARTTQELRTVLALGRPLGMVAQVAALVLLASGAWLATIGHFWTLPWVQVATGFWVVNSVVAGAVHKPATMRLAAAAFASPEGALTGELAALRRSARWVLAGNVLHANNAALLFLMVVKPGLGGSLLAVTIANGAVLAAGYALASGRRGGASAALATEG